MNKEIKNFKVKIIKERFAKEDFKIYVVDIIEGESIKTNKNNEYVINGNVHTLYPNVEYEVKGEEEIHKTFGYQYKIVNIRRDKPIDTDSSRAFLKEIITEKQTDVLLSVYPDIIDRVIKNNIEDIDLNKTKGIKEKTFNIIKNRILENFVLIDLIDRFGGALSFSNVKKLYDQYTSVRKVEQELKKDPYKCLCKLSRIAFKSADKILLNLEDKSKKDENIFNFGFDLISSKQRLRACLDYSLKENEMKGNTIASLKEIAKSCSKLTPESMQHFLEVINEEENYFVDKKRDVIAIKETYETEKYIAKTLLEVLDNSVDWNIETEVYRVDEDVKLTDEQLNTLNNLVKYNVSVLTAPAGAGKSQSVKMAVNMLEDLEKSYIMMTPTGKSSEVLAEYSGKDVGTIHRKLGFNPSATPSWGYNENRKLDVDVVFVDEFGMVDIFLMKHLLEAIDVERTKILFVFDAYQLASVGCGNIAYDLLTSGVIPINELTKIFRYGEGGLMNIATKTRNSESFLPNNFQGVQSFGTKKDYIFIQKDDVKTTQQMVQIYDKLLKDGYSIEDISVVVSQNKGAYGTKNLNKSIQDLVQSNKENNYIKRGDTIFYVGDKVIQVVNNYKALKTNGEEDHIYNGNTGIVLAIRNDVLVVGFKNKKIVYSREELEQLELGYCTTIHKMQGSSSKQVIMITPKNHAFMLNSNLLYVGETRAKERVWHVGDILTVNRAIKKKENLQRNTYLDKFLRKIIE
ncbi:AAA family ATPase [Clostridium perfringens]|uniref:AAA family ATPase n=1 Tax=Clostridium perfringens TaxID=1502 RepID=UPI00096A4DEB|nr:AAA family ATPase [Clostridium perfringens]